MAEGVFAVEKLNPSFFRLTTKMGMVTKTEKA